MPSKLENFLWFVVLPIPPICRSCFYLTRQRSGYTSESGRVSSSWRCRLGARSSLATTSGTPPVSRYSLGPCLEPVEQCRCPVWGRCFLRTATELPNFQAILNRSHMAKPVISTRYPGISDTLDGRLCPENIYRQRRRRQSTRHPISTRVHTREATSGAASAAGEALAIG